MVNKSVLGDKICQHTSRDAQKTFFPDPLWPKRANRPRLRKYGPTPGYRPDKPHAPKETYQPDRWYDNERRQGSLRNLYRKNDEPHEAPKEHAIKEELAFSRGSAGTLHSCIKRLASVREINPGAIMQGRCQHRLFGRYLIKSSVFGSQNSSSCRMSIETGRKSFSQFHLDIGWE